MEKIKVLMIDDNVKLVEMIKSYFTKHKKIELVLEANNGYEGFKIIEEQKDDYDVILLDLIMPIKDGIAVLEEMKEKNISKKVIVLTSYNTGDMIRKVSELGASYFILKPFELSELEKRIIECTNTNELDNKTVDIYHNNMQISITKLLHELGIPSHINGYRYIKDAILILYSEPKLMEEITKKLYPQVANKYETTVSRVERAIRHAIEVSWNRGNWKLMEEIFGNSVDADKAKPTNSEFVVTIADKLRLDFQTNTNK